MKTIFPEPIKCFACNRMLDKMGGLLFSPPKTTPVICQGMVDKFHLCIDCYYDAYDYLKARHREG